jgi:toxin ParE1/3/4
MQRFRDWLETLEYAAERGQLRDDIRPNIRILSFEGRLTIAFAVKADLVSVLRVFSAGRDWERDLG